MGMGQAMPQIHRSYKHRQVTYAHSTRPVQNLVHDKKTYAAFYTGLQRQVKKTLHHGSIKVLLRHPSILSTWRWSTMVIKEKIKQSGNTGREVTFLYFHRNLKGDWQDLSFVVQLVSDFVSTPYVLRQWLGIKCKSPTCDLCDTDDDQNEQHVLFCCANPSVISLRRMSRQIMVPA